MSFQPIAKRIASIFRTATRGLPGVEGNILVYIVMVMLIFGVLGVTMVTLFSTSITATAEPSESRRALYLYESGVRYGMSELRNIGFTDATINTLNQTTYNMPPSGQFEVNVFSPWFESASNQTIDPSGSVQLNVAHGDVPDGFLGKIPTSSPLLRVVNNDYINISGSGPQETAKAAVSGRSLVDSDTVQLDLLDDFVVGRGENVCFSVHPFTGGQIIVPIGSLNLDPVARNIFPKQDGAIRVRNCEYFYREARDMGDHISLLTLTTNQTICNAPMTIAADEEIILSPRNYNLTALGRSGNVTYGGDMEHSIGITSHSGRMPGDRRPDIDFGDEANLESVLNQVEQGTNPNFITVDNLNRSLAIGGGTGPSLGAVWFRDTRNIGGTRNFCSNGSCLFGQGIRVFFTVEYTGSGDGFVFSLINGNPNKNDTASAGGDIERSEMLGYSGDSRLAINPTGPSDFLDNSGPATTPGGTTVRGLIAPKIGLEFDGKVNYNAEFEKTVNYCSSASNLKADTRNDPGSSNRDAVQYVFWGNSALNINCRTQPYCGSSPGCTGDPSYDDNRHEATWPGNQNWQFNTFWSINSSPALAADGTIFVGSGSTNFYALNPDGTQKWLLDRNGAWYSPTVAPSGRIYVGSGSPENSLFAINPDTGAVIWTFPTAGAVTTKPAVRSDGSAIYFGSDDGYVYAVNSSGTQLWRFNTGSAVRSSPALSNSGNYIYFGAGSGTFYVLRADSGAFVRSTSPFPSNAFQSSPVVGPDGTIYVGNDNGRLYAFAFNSSTLTLTTPWSADPSAGSSAIQSSPAVSNDGSVVYVGSFDNNLYAFNTSNGSEKWRFTAGNDIQGPIAVDANDHIYFGSNDNRVYALYYDGTEKWRFLD